MTRLKKRAAVLVLAAVLGLGATACFPTSGPPPADPAQSAIFNATNKDRVANGLPALTWSPELSVLAGTWGAEMSRTNLHHRDLAEVLTWPDYQEYWTLGENILVGPPGMTVDQMESAWMNSSGHRANILSGNFTLMGAGLVNGPDGRTWVVVDFGAA